jgi:hypothetical protein
MPSTMTEIKSRIAIVVCSRRLRMRWAVYFETAAAGLSGADDRTNGVSTNGVAAATGAGAAAGAGATAGAGAGGCGAVPLMTGGVAGLGVTAGAGAGGASARAITVEAEADELATAELWATAALWVAPVRCVAAAICAAVAALPAAFSETGGTSPAAGMTNRAPQAGQMPRLPAKLSLTLSLCPFGQEKRIPISRSYSRWRPL